MDIVIDTREKPQELERIIPQIQAEGVHVIKNKLYVGDNGGLRRLTLREGLRLFGYPEEYVLGMSEREGYDLLGNTVVVPVIKAVAERLINEIRKQ